MTIKERYPHIDGHEDGRYLIERLKAGELAVVEGLLSNYGSKLELIIPRNAKDEVEYDGEWKVIVKGNGYSPTGFEETVLRWYEGFEDVGYMVERIRGGKLWRMKRVEKR